MIKKCPKLFFFFKLLYFMSIITLELSQKVDFDSQNLIKLKAHKEGYDLTNPNDNFFLDICLPYSYRSKDVTLEYRQKYFFFPKKKEQIAYKFSSPKRNNTYSCFSQYFKINRFENYIIIVKYINISSFHYYDLCY